MRNLIRDQRKSIRPFWLASWMYFLKLKMGPLVTDARGSIAGNTISRNHYGLYMRARTTPINPNTARQIAVRDAITYLAARWAGTLTLLQRQAWDLYGSSVAMQDSLGATMYLTGYNHYMRSNVISLAHGGTAIDAGPVIFELPAKDPTLAVTCSEAAQTLVFTLDAAMAWAVETGGLMFFFQGKPQNAQRTYFGGPWRFLGALAGIDPGGPVPPHAYVVQFAIAEGQHQWAYARIKRADGRLSEPFQVETFCAA